MIPSFPSFNSKAQYNDGDSIHIKCTVFGKYRRNLHQQKVKDFTNQSWYCWRVIGCFLRYHRKAVR